MKQFGDRIPNKVLREIFPRRINRNLAAEQIYTHIKRTILSGKLTKGQKLFRVKIAQDFGVNIVTVSVAFSKLKKHRFVIVKRGVGSFVA
jgi:DNA-binding transcriptional regulator YhcF (GntR family)